MSLFSPDFKSLKDIDKATQELRERNEARAAAMKEEMGKRFVLHPFNAPKKRKPKSVLK